MQGPPPPMMQPMQSMMGNRNRLIVVTAVALGLFLLMAGAILYNLGNQTYATTPSADQIAANTNLRTVWAPIVMDLGMFFFVGGLVLAAIIIEELDPFVRIFLLVLAFVALLLILANPSNIFA